jgi:hypothetical protein
MKKILSTLLPAFSLLTLGGCASTAGLSTTESDGVYYSSSDRTTQSAPAVAAAMPATRDELTNPDYTDQGSSAAATDESTEYYDDDYAYSSRIRRFHQPYYRSFGYGYNDFIYADPFWYGGPAYYSAWGPGFGYGGYDPFWGGGYGYGSFVNINIGFGSPWGWGRPWGWNRWGGGYGRGFYDGFYSGYYGGGYGGYGGGYYNNGGYYGNSGYYGNGNGGGTVNQRYGPRSSRSAEAVTSGHTGGSSAGTGGGTSTGGGRGRVSEGGLVAPGTTAGSVVGSNPAPVPGRRNVRMADAATNGTPGVRGTRNADLGTDGAAGQTAPDRSTGITRSPALQDAAAEQPTRSYEGRRWRVAQDGAGSTAQPQPSTDYSQPRRSNRSIFNQSQQGSSGQSSEEPVRRASPQRAYEAPQRSYEAPQRSYEAPSRSSESSRSYSAPSSGGGNSGGGNSGGGRGRVE